MDDNFLLTPLPPDIADLPPAAAAALAAGARERGFAVFELDGAAMPAKPALMDHVAQRLAFPSDFGRNWDAMVDYLGDMATVHKNEKVLIVVNSSEKIGGGDKARAADFRKVCGYACANAREWSRDTVILKFIFA
jgi:hypothetical protein